MLVHSFNQLSHIHNKLARKSGPCLPFHLLTHSTLATLTFLSVPKMPGLLPISDLDFSVFTIWNLFPQVSVLLGLLLSLVLSSLPAYFKLCSISTFPIHLSSPLFSFRAAITICLILYFTHLLSPSLC